MSNNPTKNKIYVSIINTGSHSGEYLCKTIGFRRYIKTKKEAEQIKKEFNKFGLDYIVNKYPKRKLNNIPHIIKNPLTYETFVEKLKTKFPDNMIGINKIIYVYKKPKLYTNPKTHHSQKVFYVRLKCTKCGLERKVAINNLYSSSNSCQCQNIEIFKEDYIGKVYGDFEIIGMEKIRNNYSRNNQRYIVLKTRCIHCGNEQITTYNWLVLHKEKEHLCSNCHKDIKTINNQIATLKKIYSSNDDNGSNIKGVWFDKYKQKWCARISQNIIDNKGKVKTRHFFLGEFNNYDDAVAARMYAVEHRLLELENKRNE